MLLILASASPARQTMLRDAGLKCFAIPAGLDEAAIKRSFTGDAGGLALALASAKAAMVAKTYPHALVIGADQLLVCGEEKFDKPADMTQAAAQLRFLSGRTHTLVTSVCVHKGESRIWAHTDQARLTMRPLSDAFIAQYLKTEGAAVLGCVGTYRLEGLGAQLFHPSRAIFSRFWV